MTLDTMTRITCTIDAGLARVVLNVPDRGNPIDGVFLSLIHI